METGEGGNRPLTLGAGIMILCPDYECKKTHISPTPLLKGLLSEKSIFRKQINVKWGEFYTKSVFFGPKTGGLGWGKNNCETTISRYINPSAGKKMPVKRGVLPLKTEYEK